VRSVQVRCSRFSRRCHLIIDLFPSHDGVGQAIDAVTGTRLLSFCFSFRGTILIYAAAGIVFGIIRYLGWQAGIRILWPTQRLSAYWVAPTNAPIGISGP
jgi:hypothetical protein